MKSLKDIELGLKSPMESFPSINPQSVAGREYACLGQKTEHFNLSTELDKAFHCVRKMKLIYLVPECKCVMVKFSEKHNTLLSYVCKTGFATKILDPSSVA